MLRQKVSYLVNLATCLATNHRPVIYVAGKVTGLKPDDYIAKFKAAQTKLEADGWLVLNPCNFIGPEESWETAMRMALTLLNMSDTIYMLPDWGDSKGAKLEFALAAEMGINVVFE